MTSVRQYHHKRNKSILCEVNPIDQCLEKDNIINANAFKVIIKDELKRRSHDRQAHLDLSDGESGLSSTEDLDTPCDSGDEATSGRASPVVSKSRTSIPEIQVEDLSISNKGSHPSVNEGRSHSTALSYRKHLLLEDSEDASSGYESAASIHKPNRTKKRVSSSKRTQLLRAAMLAEHALVHNGTRTQDSEARRAQDVYLDVNTSNNAQQSSEDESSTYEDVEGSHPNEESSHFETDEGSHSTIDSPSSDEEQTGEGETIRICIVDPLETQSETDVTEEVTHKSGIHPDEIQTKCRECNIDQDTEHLCKISLEEEESPERFMRGISLPWDLKTSTSPHITNDKMFLSGLGLVDNGINGKESDKPDTPGKNSDKSEPLSTLEHRPMKMGKQRFRWNLLFNVLVWLIVPLPLWAPFVSSSVAMYLIPGIQAVFTLMWVVIITLAARTMITLYRYRNYDFKSDYPSYTDIRHLVAISCYKEPVSLIQRSVQSLADQTEAARITMTISFEEKTPDVQKKIQELRNIFANSFERLLFTIHPFGLENEIPGKCSNANHGLRESTKVLQSELGEYFDASKIIVTTCDADSKFHPKYMEALTSRFLNEKTPHGVVFQAPLLYNWGLDGASFVTRVTGILRSTLMMGALIPFNINTMSIFSFSLKLCMEGNFVHPGYQMDDIICLIRWMGVTGKRLRIPLIPVPVISGPTSGETIEIELSEWARQARRWTIGAGEVFHYYVIKAGRMPFIPAFSWGLCFLTYYGILLCSAGLYGVTASISLSLLIEGIPSYITYTMYGFAGLQQLCFLVMFLLDVAGPRLMNIKEHISFVRNALHWFLTPFVLIGYSLVELYALHEVMVRGKEVCKHGASKKGALQAA